MAFLLVSDKTVRESITVEECLCAVEAGFRAFASPEAADTYTQLLDLASGSSLHLYAASALESGVAAKILGAYPSNPARRQPYIRAVVVLLDPITGELEALLDGRYLTALRTGAATALGAKYLGRRDSRVLGILGTGLQARTHLLAHLAVHPFERVLVWGRTKEHVADYLRDMGPQVAIPLVASPTPEELCAEADVLTCTTSARVPLFRPEAIRPGTHIGVTAPMSHRQTEIPLELLESARLFVDSETKFLHHWDTGSEPPVAAELGDVIVGRDEGRHVDDEITIFKPEGMAFEDLVTARVVVDHVHRAQSGQYISW